MGVDFGFRISDFGFSDSLPPSQHTKAGVWPIGGPPPTPPARSRAAGRQIRNPKSEIRNWCRFVEPSQ